jgi:hypothetical protein
MPYSPTVQPRTDLYLRQMWQGIDADHRKREELLGMLDALKSEKKAPGAPGWETGGAWNTNTATPDAGNPNGTGAEADGGGGLWKTLGKVGTGALDVLSGVGNAGLGVLGALTGQKSDAQKEAEKADKRQGKVADALQLLASEAGMPPGQAKGMSNERIMGFLAGQQQNRQMADQAQMMAERAKGMQYKDALITQMQNQEAARQRAEALATQQGEDLGRAAYSIAKGQVGDYFENPERYSSPPDLAQSILEHPGIAPAVAPDYLSLYAKQQTARRTPAYGVPGTVTPVPGAPGAYAFWNSPDSTSAFHVPRTGPAEPKEAMIGGKPSGWALFPDGEWRSLKAEKPPLDLAQFDTDGDGVISLAEFTTALGALPFLKEYGIAPGMKVKPGSASAPAAPATGANLWERLQQWRKKK